MSTNIVNTPSQTIPDDAASNRWVAFIEGMPEIEFKLYDFVPSNLTTGIVDLGGVSDTKLNWSGDRLQIDEVTLSFYIDKVYGNYMKAYAWMRNNINSNTPDYRDITIHLLDNQNKFQGVSIQYQECLPMMLAQPLLDNNGLMPSITTNFTVAPNDIKMICEPLGIEL